jgi:amino acid transporter
VPRRRNLILRFVQYAGIAGSLGRFLGFWATLTQAAFSYIGTEIVAIAAGEAKNPRRNLPRAIKRVYVRILIFYLGGTFIIGILVPSNSEGLKLNSGNALASPFVIAIRQAGIPALPSIINACLLTSAWSAASSDLFTSSRALFGLAINGQAPKFFARTTKSGLPYVAVGFCSLFGLLAFMSLQSTAGKVFGYFANLTAAAGLMSWWGICLIYIRFHAGMKAQGISRAELPYASAMNKGAFAAWYAIIAITVILFFSGWSVFLAGNWDTSTVSISCLPRSHSSLLLPCSFPAFSLRLPCSLPALFLSVQLADVVVRHKLLPCMGLPPYVDHLQARHSLSLGPSGRDGLCVWSCRGRGRLVRRASSQEYRRKGVARHHVGSL